MVKTAPPVPAPALPRTEEEEAVANIPKGPSDEAAFELPDETAPAGEEGGEKEQDIQEIQPLPPNTR